MPQIGGSVFKNVTFVQICSHYIIETVFKARLLSYSNQHIIIKAHGNVCLGLSLVVFKNKTCQPNLFGTLPSLVHLTGCKEFTAKRYK